MPSLPARGRSLLEVAIAQLWFYRGRSALAIAGVALSVLVIAILVGLGHGVTTRGVSGIANLNRDLWLSAPVGVAPASVGGLENGLLDAHEVARTIDSRPDVRGAQAVGFQSVYVSPDGSDFETIAGVGVTGSSAPIPVTRGSGFSRADAHYANGSYDGPMTHEVLVDEQIADAMNVSVGDSLYVGGTIADARRNEFEVVGVTSAISTFVGVPTIVVPLGELQALTGSTGTDPAAYVTITLPSDADPAAVATDIEAAYPEYDVRTNRQQFRSVVAGHGPVIASATAIAAVAIVFGMALVINVLGLLVYQERADFAALLSIGISTRSLVLGTVVQGLVVGIIGAAVGLVAVVFVTAAVNSAVASLIGFEGIVRLAPWIYVLAAGLAVAMGLVGGGTAGWRLVRMNPTDHLR